MGCPVLKLAPKLEISSLGSPVLKPGRFQVWAQHIYGFQSNLLTDFEAPGPYQIQFMASYLDLCTPIPPVNMHDTLPYQTEDTRL